MHPVEIMAMVPSPNSFPSIAATTMSLPVRTPPLTRIVARLRKLLFTSAARVSDDLIAVRTC